MTHIKEARMGAAAPDEHAWFEDQVTRYEERHSRFEQLGASTLSPGMTATSVRWMP